MITAQDIREKTFEKARLNGYDMASVDDFLEELADDITASQKENAVLKSKMKVLVDKIEEYRANEEALNMAILSAQKLAVQIEKDARERASAMLEEADAQVKAKLGSIEEETVSYERRLAEAKASTARFMESVRAMLGKQLQELDVINSGVLPKAPAVQSAAPADNDVRIADGGEEKAEPDFELDLSGTDDELLKTFESTKSFTV